jgi:subtilisin family serine protease
MKKHYLILIFILAAGFFLWAENNLSRAGTTENATSVETNVSQNFTESEAIVKIDSPQAAFRVAQKENLIISPILPDTNNQNLYRVQSPEQKPVEKIISDIQKNPAVKSAQPNFKYKPLASVTNDKYYTQQWSLSPTYRVAGGVDAESAWGLEAKKQTNIVIGIIDTGANYNHKDLKQNLSKGSAQGRNINRPKNKPTDTDGHGTFIAGIIAAVTKNKIGVAGASYYNHLRVMPLKFDFTTEQAITAINYAKSKGVPIINASWGSYGDEGLDLVLKDTIAAYPGVFVTAAGNGDDDGNGYDHDGADPNQKMYPCDFDLPNIICVGASDRDGNLAYYSDYGAASVDVIAPGGTETADIIGLGKGKNGYSSAEGSSLSTAFVTAEAGLLLSKKPALSNIQIIQIIENSVDTNSSSSGKIKTGGKINFMKALQLAASY